jgi:hypothetical protein
VRRPHPGIVGKVTRHRLNPGGDRQASHALWRIVFTRLGSDPATRAYAGRRTKEGKSKAEITRWPSNDSSAVPGLIFLTCSADLIRACVPPGRPSLMSATQQ